jgi:hypothetical protein
VVALLELPEQSVVALPKELSANGRECSRIRKEEEENSHSKTFALCVFLPYCRLGFGMILGKFGGWKKKAGKWRV